ncbi:MAG: hypothetical protein WC832_02045 [Anaerolineales bacterium]
MKFVKSSLIAIVLALTVFGLVSANYTGPQNRVSPDTDAVRRVTAIAQVEKRPRGEETLAAFLWQYDKNSTPGQPRWSQVKEMEIAL